MGLLSLFRRNVAPDNVSTETRSAMSAGFTAQIIAARESWITGLSDVAELSATVQGCVSLWEGAFASADVEGTDMLPRAALAMLARSVALRGEALFLIRDRLIPVSDWDLSTVDGMPRAYRVTVPEVGGGRSETVLAAEVVHVRLASDPYAPWAGQAPLRRSALSAGMLQAVEEALREVWREAPIGSQVLPLPDGSADDMQAMRAAFRGRRGSTLIVEGMAQAVAAGMHPLADKRREDLTPDLHKAEAGQLLAQAQASVCHAFGVLPALLNPSTTGPVVREAQRHLAQWTLEPLAKLVAEEATEKLGGVVSIDVVRPLQAFDMGAKSRSVLALVNAGLSPADALRLTDLD